MIPTMQDSTPEKDSAAYGLDSDQTRKADGQFGRFGAEEIRVSHKVVVVWYTQLSTSPSFPYLLFAVT